MIEEQITREDLAELIRIAKDHTGWTYDEMEHQTGIPLISLRRYVAKQNYPKNPNEIVTRVKRALSEHTKEKMKVGLS